MIVITDSNIIYSILRNPDGEVAKVFYAKSKIQFTTPDFLIEEVKNHFNDLINEKTTKKDINDRLNKALEKIKIINLETISKEHITKSLEIVKDIDIDDYVFVALYLYKKHKIWTGDRKLINGLLKKGYDICITTSQLKAYIYKKNTHLK